MFSLRHFVHNNQPLLFLLSRFCCFLSIKKVTLGLTVGYILLVLSSRWHWPGGVFQLGKLRIFCWAVKSESLFSLCSNDVSQSFPGSFTCVAVCLGYKWSTRYLFVQTCAQSVQKENGSNASNDFRMGKCDIVCYGKDICLQQETQKSKNKIKTVMPVNDYVLLVFIKNKNFHHSVIKSSQFGMWQMFARFRSLRFFMRELCAELLHPNL